MGCNCCKEVNHADYKKCQQDIDRILRNCKTTSSKQYLLLMASLLHLMQRLQCQKRRNVKIGDKIMNARQRKKYCDYAICSHRVYNVDILPCDPYFPIIEDYCKL